MADENECRSLPDSRPVVLITGAASGIGASTAERFAAGGWRVYATDIDDEFPARVAADCQCLELDVTDETQIQGVVDRILDETGRIDTLVANAGFAVPGAVEDVSVDDSRRQFDVLVHGAHRLIQAVLPAMRAQNRGRLIVVSSVLGRSASPGVGTYGAAKAAVESLVDSLRMELRNTEVTVSVVEPAWVETAFSSTASDRLGDERTDAYSETYRLLDSGWVLDGGPLAVTPAAVAKQVFKAATVDEPSTRYPVGWQSRLTMLSRYLPDRLRDSITTRLLAGSVWTRRWFDRQPTATNPAGSTTDSTAKTVELSTGQTVSVPLETEASLSGVTISADYEAVDGLLPASLSAVRLTPRRSAVVVLSVDYKHVSDGSLGPYNEVGIMIPAVPAAGPLSTVRQPTQIGGYVWQLPVTTEPACVLGREIWGYPKSVAAVEITTAGKQTETHLHCDGQHVLSLAVELPSTHSVTVPLSSYTQKDGTLIRTPLSFQGALGCRPLSRRVDWQLGDHSWAERLRSASLGRPLAVFGGTCRFEIGHPEVVG